MQINCPICRRKTIWEENPWRPFCSERCKLVDFGEWVTEGYKIEGEKKEGEREDKTDGIL